MSNQENVDGRAISVSRNGATGVISIERPHRRNSMDKEFVDQSLHALRELGSDPSVQVIIFHAKTSGFCAGSDLKYIGPMMPNEIVQFEITCGELGRQIALLPKPVIASVEEFAIGGGFTLATCCDLVVSSREAKWALPEVPIGWLTPWGIWSLQSRCGDIVARQLCYCIDDINATEAHELGIVDYVCAPGEALKVASEIASKLEELPQSAMEETKRFFSRLIVESAEVGEARSSRMFAENLNTAAAKITLEKFSPPHRIS